MVVVVLVLVVCDTTGTVLFWVGRTWSTGLDGGGDVVVVVVVSIQVGGGDVVWGGDSFTASSN